MSFASPTLTGQFDSVCPRRLPRLVAVNMANKQDDVIIDFCLIVFLLGVQTAPETDIRTDGFVVEDDGEGRNRTGSMVDVFSFQRKRNELEQKKKRTVALSRCLDFSGVVSCAQEMETKLNHRQREENREKNQEHFSLERIKQAGEQQEFGDEQHMLYQTKSAYVSNITIEHRGDLKIMTIHIHVFTTLLWSLQYMKFKLEFKSKEEEINRYTSSHVVHVL